MNSRDLQDLKEGVLEVFSEFYSTNVFYYPLLTKESGNIYNEKLISDKEYGEPLQLVARIDFQPEKDKGREARGTNERVTGIFEIPLVSLEKAGLDTVGTEELKRGILVFKDKAYDIVNIIPVTHVGDIFLLYNFEVGGSTNVSEINR